MKFKTYSSSLTLEQLGESIKKGIQAKRSFGYVWSKEPIIKNKDEFKLEIEIPAYEKRMLAKIIKIKALKAGDNKTEITIKSKNTGHTSIMNALCAFCILLGLLAGIIPGILIFIFVYFVHFKPLNDFEKRTVEEFEDMLKETELRYSQNAR